MVVHFASLNLGEYPDGIAELFSAEGAIIEQRGVNKRSISEPKSVTHPFTSTFRVG